MVTSDTEMKINLKKVITGGKAEDHWRKKMSSGKVEGAALQGMSTHGEKGLCFARVPLLRAAVRQPGKKTVVAGRGRRAE